MNRAVGQRAKNAEMQDPESLKGRNSRDRKAQVLNELSVWMLTVALMRRKTVSQKLKSYKLSKNGRHLYELPRS